MLKLYHAPAKDTFSQCWPRNIGKLKKSCKITSSQQKKDNALTYYWFLKMQSCNVITNVLFKYRNRKSGILLSKDRFLYFNNHK